MYVSLPPLPSSSWADFADTLNVTGWGVLNVVTNPAFEDRDTMYAAG